MKIMASGEFVVCRGIKAAGGLTEVKTLGAVLGSGAGFCALQLACLLRPLEFHSSCTVAVR